jgi:hypothetical protein
VYISRLHAMYLIQSSFEGEGIFLLRDVLDHLGHITLV